MLCPFDILYRSSRKWLGVTLGRIILSFCFPVEFRDFFIADELNSLSYSLWTFSYFFCAYSWNWCNMAQMWVAPTLASLPPLWRLLQCLRRYRDSNEKVHLLNAAKYISSIMATFATGARPSIPVSAFWFLACLINSIYTSTWDIKMDWGLLQSNSKYFLLRNELVFRKWAYYTAAPINILLRFTWTLSIVPLRINGLALGVLLAALECYRRIQWNFFRLENEHLNNCGQYRAIKEIPLPFALLETDLAPEALCDEERISTCSSKSIPPKQENYSTISMPSKKDKSHSLASTMAIPASHYSYNDRISFGGMSESGNQESFYGRRDFDDSSNIVIGSINTNRLGRRPSTLNNVFARIKSLDHSDHSEESEGDDDDDCYTSFYNTREN
ncbi:EXS family-domain-containing protein [Gilbertella persicaria]|uniref:EXS family-domain-containing protein n=1 Tax=Gilbertella persicaria TaxID=101096 RepID=UPI0022206D35|nr:EXS family-domain-containing protein [Gilbertella persicaria]KAI8090063.1 EXS family-domain-containing protein [Gilbertella persicaria]